MPSKTEEVIATVFFIIVGISLVAGLVIGQIKHWERIEDCNERGGTYVSYACVSDQILIPLER